MSADEIFNQLGFAPSLKREFMELAAFIEAPEGCQSSFYSLPKLKQARGALMPPGEAAKNARGVFVLIEPRRGGIQVSPIARFGRGVVERSRRELVTVGFTEWKALKSDIRECCLAARQTKKPRTETVRGDGVALPGGAFESKRSRH